MQVYCIRPELRRHMLVLLTCIVSEKVLLVKDIGQLHRAVPFTAAVLFKII